MRFISNNEIQTQKESKNLKKFNTQFEENVVTENSNDKERKISEDYYDLIDIIRNYREILKYKDKEAKAYLSLANNLIYFSNNDFYNVFFTENRDSTIDEVFKIINIYNRKGKVIYIKGDDNGNSIVGISIGDELKKSKINYMHYTIEANSNDAEYIHDIIKKEIVSAIIFETIQTENELNFVTKEFLEIVRKYANNQEILFILNETNLDFGRTGEIFAYQKYNIEPDILLLSSDNKSAYCINAILMQEDIYNYTYKHKDNKNICINNFREDVSQNGTKILNVLIANSKLEKLDAENLKNIKEKGRYIEKEINEKLKDSRLFKGYVGYGLIFGVKLNIPNIEGVFKYLSLNIISILKNKYGISAYISKNNIKVIKFLPKLDISIEEIDFLINALKETLYSFESFKELGTDTIKKVLTKKI